MGVERTIREFVMVTTLLVGAAPVVAASPEPLIVTPLPEPDLHYVSLSGQERISVQKSAEDSQLDDAIESFGRALGEAQRQQRATIEAACKSVKAPHAVRGDISDWWANCRYNRR
jgi:hypothetical protein